MTKLKPYALKNSDNTAVIPGSLILSNKKPKTGNWFLVNEKIERNIVNSVNYDNVVKSVYPNAIYANEFGEKAKNFIHKNYNYYPNNIILSNSICSDDVDGPVFSDVSNIGQNPASLNQFLGAFMSGGLSGFPHTGTLGIAAWASHATTTTNGALFLINTPHIGITQNPIRVNNEDHVGRIQRRGKPDVGTTDDNTCGAIATAINAVISYGGVIPDPQDFPTDYQLWLLISFLSGDFAYFNAHSYSENMLYATEIIRWVGDDYLRGSEGISVTTIPADIDVFYCSGTFINTDDECLAYVDINSFWHYKNNSWNDLTTSFLNS